MPKPRKYKTFAQSVREAQEANLKPVGVKARVARKKRSARAQRDPKDAETRYRSALGILAHRVEVAARGEMASLLSNDDLVRAEAAQRIEGRLYDILRVADRNAIAAFNRTTKHARAEVKRILKVQPYLDQDGISTARDSFLAKQIGHLRKAVRDQLQSFRDRPPQEEYLSRVFRFRMNLISHDEVFKLHEKEVARWAQLAGGATGIYHTHKDERVRPSHAALEGIRFYLDSPPHQLGEPNCRCKLVPELALK